MWLFIYLEKRDLSKGININIFIHKEALPNFQPLSANRVRQTGSLAEEKTEVDQDGMLFISK